MPLTLDPIEEVIDDVRAGRLVIIVDDKDRENEGDLMVAAELTTPQNIAFMMEHGKGLVCLSLTQDRLQKLQLPLQVTENRTTFHTNFAVSFDHASVVPYGVSAEGRATTIRAAVDDNASADDFVRPGFMYPLQAVSGGVLRRDGQTEGSVDLASLAGLKPAGVICEVMDANGQMLRDEDLAEYCREHKLKVTSVEAIREYRLSRERTVRRVASCKVDDLRFAPCQAEIPNPGRGESFRAIVYVDDSTNEEHLAVVRGTPRKETLVRIHSECLTGDIFNSRRCDCGQQLAAAFQKIVEEKEGIVIYLHQEGRGIGLANKLRAYALQDQGLDTVDANIKLGFAADLRNYRSAAQILEDMGIKRVRLITNNPEKISALEGFGLKVIERVAIPTHWDADNEQYLKTKVERFGHLLTPPK